MTANQFRVQVTNALTYLNDVSPLHQERVWYRRGSKGSLHSDARCHKLHSWSKESVSFTAAQAAKKKTCTSCTSRTASSMLASSGADSTSLRAARSASAMADALTAGEKHLQVGTMSAVGEAMNCYDEYGSILGDMTKDDTKLVSKALKVLESAKVAFASEFQEASQRVTRNAAPWAASAIARKIVVASESNIPDADGSDIVLYGENTDPDKDNIHMLSRIYLRWHRVRVESSIEAKTAALALLQQASFRSVEQLNFMVDPPAQPATLLLAWAKEAWQTETQTRLLERLIPAWEKRHTDLTSKTEIKLVGIGCESLRSKAGRVLTHAYPVCRRNGCILALVPEVIALYLLAAEQKWPSDKVEITEACSPEALEVVATLWDPYNAKATFQSLRDAALAADKL